MTAINALVFLLSSVVAALVPAAPRGFAWKHIPELGVTVQVPDGWHSRTLTEKGTKVLQITKEKPTADGFEAGLTINLTQASADSQMSAAILIMGDYMAKLHDTFTKIVESRVNAPGHNPAMILEGVRTLPDHKERGLYHTRTSVYILKPQRRIYTIIFGSPAGRWEADNKQGNVMLNPIQFDE